MKFLIQFLVILVSAYVLELFLPWWSIAISGAAGGYFFKSGISFLSGFLAIALLWTGKAYLIDMTAAVPLTDQIATILLIKSKALLFLITALVGGLVGGFSSLTGSLAKK